MKFQKLSRFQILTTAVIVSGILLFFPEGRMLLYPLSLLSTFFHEMFHGLVAQFVCHFEFTRLTIDWDGSGSAQYEYDANIERENHFLYKEALIAVSGFFGPILVGFYLLVISNFHVKISRVSMSALALFIFSGTLLYIRDSYLPATFLILTGVFLLYITWKTNDYFFLLSTQFIGLHMGLAIFSDMDYIFVKYKDEMDLNNPAESKHSIQDLTDTGYVSEYLGISHQIVASTVFCAGVIFLLCGLFICYKMSQNMKQPTKSRTKLPL